MEEGARRRGAIGRHRRAQVAAYGLRKARCEEALSMPSVRRTMPAGGLTPPDSDGDGKDDDDYGFDDGDFGF